MKQHTNATARHLDTAVMVHFNKITFFFGILITTVFSLIGAFEIRMKIFLFLIAILPSYPLKPLTFIFLL